MKEYLINYQEKKNFYMEYDSYINKLYIFIYKLPIYEHILQTNNEHIKSILGNVDIS